MPVQLGKLLGNGPCFTVVYWHVQVRMHVHRRSARLGYFPAYHLHYVHGEKYTPSRADIVPAPYDALIGAADRKPRVCAELHPSPLKSQVGPQLNSSDLAGLLAFLGLTLGCQHLV